MTKILPYLLNLAGEYRVCSELNKRGVFATVTYGNRKGADLYAISDRKERALKIEVKTSQAGNFVTSITQKALQNSAVAPDFWVLFNVRPGDADTFRERFFILSHAEICRVQAARNRVFERRYFDRHRRKPDLSVGVDNVRIADVEQFENQWAKIINRIGTDAAEPPRVNRTRRATAKSRAVTKAALAGR